LSRLSQNQLVVGTATSKDKTFNTRVSILNTWIHITHAMILPTRSSQCHYITHTHFWWAYIKRPTKSFNIVFSIQDLDNEQCLSSDTCNSSVCTRFVLVVNDTKTLKNKRCLPLRMENVDIFDAHRCKIFAYLFFGVSIIRNISKLGNIWGIDFFVFSANKFKILFIYYFSHKSLFLSFH
jgi:hypothetical protein